MNNRRHWFQLVLTGFLGASSWSILATQQGAALPVYRGDGSANVRGLSQGINNTIRVTGSRGAVKWESFNVEKGEIFRIEGNRQQTILNRVVGTDPSTIGGTVKSDPQFILSNPNGITVLGTGRVVAPSSVLMNTSISL
jgi:filamentous hemagglutinin family protein